MRLIFDTHTLLWIVTNDSKLSKKAKSLFLNSKNEILFSFASIWEMAIKINLGRLSIDQSLKEFIKHHIKGNDIKLLSIELNHILLLENLPQHHRDPFDRLLICQAIAENIPIISSDKDLDLYTIKRIW
jgi:PIN domain nuclease of toxin-antitoxin system